MTSVSSTSTLKTLMALYENENSSAGGSATLTQDQVGTIEGMLKGTASSSGSSDTVDTLLGTSTTSSDDLSSIIDTIEAKTADASSTASSDTTTTAQKAVTMMQSLYQSQQSNLFTLIG